MENEIILLSNPEIGELSIGKTIDLYLPISHAKKIYGLIAFAFKEYEKGKRDISEETIMSLIHVSEALAVLIDRSSGMSPDISDISLTSKKIGRFE
jgi:hypothetical protein